MENVFEGLLAAAHKHVDYFENNNKQIERIKNDIIEAAKIGKTSINAGNIPPFIIDELKEEGFEVYIQSWQACARISWA